MPPTLLVVDDNLSVRESLRFLLLRRGYNVHVADGGPAAIALAQQQPIDGAMVDVQMPGMNGFEVCEALRQHAASSGRTLAMWMMTGGRSPELMKRATEVGALTLLGKPFDFTELFRQFDEQFGPVEPVRDAARL